MGITETGKAVLLNHESVSIIFMRLKASLMCDQGSSAEIQ